MIVLGDELDRHFGSRSELANCEIEFFQHALVFVYLLSRTAGGQHCKVFIEELAYGFIPVAESFHSIFSRQLDDKLTK